jgi:hypothetical protein
MFIRDRQRWAHEEEVCRRQWALREQLREMERQMEIRREARRRLGLAEDENPGP